MTRIKIILFLVCAFFLRFVYASPEDEPEFIDLADQLDYMAMIHGFDIEGLELTKSLPPKVVGGQLRKQLKLLLTGYNYAVVQEPGENIERIIILRYKAKSLQPTVIEAQKKGKHHVVQVAITGPSGIKVSVPMIVDTGADKVVLPKSMMLELELEAEPVVIRKLQTANGVADAVIARLTLMEIGDEKIQDVEAAFVEDSLLGGSKLLGMNVLKDFNLTIEDKGQRITLTKPE